MPDYTVKADVDSMLRADNDAGIRSAIGLGQTDAPTFLAQTLTGQSLTGTQATSLVDLNAIWNTDGNPSLIYGRVTNTKSGTTANLIDLGTAIGGSLFKVTKVGEISTAGNITSANSIGVGFFGGNLNFYAGDIGGGKKAVSIIDGWSYAFSSGTQAVANQDIFLTRDAAGILAQRNGSAAQTQRTYNNYTSATVFERGTFGFPIGTNRLRIGTEFLGAGMAALPIDFVTGDVVRMSIAATGTTNFTGAASFNSSITCVSDFNGERDIYCGTNRYFRFNVGGATALSSSAAGVVTMADLGATNTTPRITLGGTTSSFPAIKRSTTSLQARLADDSAFTNIQGKLTTDTAYTATVVVPTGFLTLYDSTGTAYRVPCVV
jgi:hypothetical protein